MTLPFKWLLFAVVSLLVWTTFGFTILWKVLVLAVAIYALLVSCVLGSLVIDANDKVATPRK